MYTAWPGRRTASSVLCPPASGSIRWSWWRLKSLSTNVLKNGVCKNVRKIAKLNMLLKSFIFFIFFIFFNPFQSHRFLVMLKGPAALARARAWLHLHATELLSMPPCKSRRLRHWATIFINVRYVRVRPNSDENPKWSKIGGSFVCSVLAIHAVRNPKQNTNNAPCAITISFKC